MNVYIRDINRSFIRFGVVIHFHIDEIDSPDIWNEAYGLICEKSNLEHLKGKLKNPPWKECILVNEKLKELVFMLQLQGKKMIYLTDEELADYDINVVQQDGKYFL
jgi:hypothetical protein